MGPRRHGTGTPERALNQSEARDASRDAKREKASWLRPGEVLIHIGPHKTGTTALQSSLAAARTKLANAGVLYPGPLYNHYRASTQLDREPGRDHSEWSKLVTAVSARTDRAIVSSEYFDQVDARTARLAIDQLGGSDARVLITLRPLRKVLPGLWQQYVKNGSSTGLDVWLNELLTEDRSHPLWQSLDQGKLAARWADAVGQDRLAVLVVDAARPAGLLRDFEKLVGLPRRFLQQQDSNRSLTAPEAELIRTLNGGSEILQKDPDLRKRWIRFGAIKHLVENRNPNPWEPPLTMPAWAAAEIRVDQSRTINDIRELGVHVVGDLKSLESSDSVDPQKTPTLRPTGSSEIDLPDSHDVVANEMTIDLRENHNVIAHEVAIDLLVGLTQKADGTRQRLQSQMLRERNARRNAERKADSVGLDQVTGRELASELARRGRTRAKRMLRRRPNAGDKLTR